MATMMTFSMFAVLVVLAMDISLAKNLDEPCTAKTECTVENSDCTGDAGSMTCSCMAGYKSQSATECAMIELDGVCTSNGDCKVGNSECTGAAESMTCSCKAGYKKKSNTECTMNEIDDTCTSNADCKVEYTECVGDAGNKKCSCKKGYKTMTKTSCETNGTTGFALNIVLLISCIAAAFYSV